MKCLRQRGSQIVALFAISLGLLGTGCVQESEPLQPTFKEPGAVAPVDWRELDNTAEIAEAVGLLIEPLRAHLTEPHDQPRFIVDAEGMIRYANFMFPHTPAETTRLTEATLGKHLGTGFLDGEPVPYQLSCDVEELPTPPRAKLASTLEG